MKNATYLFEQPSRSFKNSESRWTAVAQMSLIYLSMKRPGSKLHYYRTDKDGWLNDSGFIVIDNFRFENTVCEQGLTGGIFNLVDFENKFNGIVPDIIRLDHESKTVTIIEVKTLSESVRRNIKLYAEFESYIQSKGWGCELFYLISHGHEKQNDWPALSKVGARILLWEDLFRIMADSEMADVIGSSLGNFCDPYQKLAQQDAQPDAFGAG